MQQSTTFLMIMSGLLLMFYIFGVIPANSTANSTLLTAITNPQNLKTGAIVTAILFYVGAAGISSVLLGFFVKNTEMVMMIPIGTYLLGLLWDFGIVYNALASASMIFALLICAPIMFIWIFTVIDYIRGRD